MKVKVKSSVKKRFYKTKGGKGKVMRNLSNHKHRLIPKSKRVKQAAGRNHGLKSNIQHNKVSNILN